MRPQTRPQRRPSTVSHTVLCQRRQRSRRPTRRDRERVRDARWLHPSAAPRRRSSCACARTCSARCWAVRRAMHTQSALPRETARALRKAKCTIRAPSRRRAERAACHRKGRVLRKERVAEEMESRRKGHIWQSIHITIVMGLNAHV